MTFIELVWDPACCFKPSPSTTYSILLPPHLTPRACENSSRNLVSHHPQLQSWNRITSTTNPQNLSKEGLTVVPTLFILLLLTLEVEMNFGGSGTYRKGPVCSMFLFSYQFSLFSLHACFLSFLP